MNSGIKLSYNSQIQKKKIYFIYLIKGPKTKKVHFILSSALWGLGHILQKSLFWPNLNGGIPSAYLLTFPWLQPTTEVNTMYYC